jgi:hypothetical protein
MEKEGFIQFKRKFSPKTIGIEIKREKPIGMK